MSHDRRLKKWNHFEVKHLLMNYYLLWPIMQHHIRSGPVWILQYSKKIDCILYLGHKNSLRFSENNFRFTQKMAFERATDTWD